MMDIQLIQTPIDVAKCTGWVTEAPEAGGIAIFIGTVRKQTRGKEVVRLEFEAYEAMAIKEMKKIVEESCKKWPLQRVNLHHRTGNLNVGEIPVFIGVASAHRAAAFEACQYIIDTLKQTVPIWKKEVFKDGEIWVAAHP